MMPKPICSRSEYEMALRDMEAYFEHEPDTGSPEAQRFDELLRMLENFEAAHYIIECPGCGEIRLELQEDQATHSKDLKAITEQVLAEFCQGCASHLSDQSWQATDLPVATWVSQSSNAKNSVHERSKRSATGQGKDS